MMMARFLSVMVLASVLTTQADTLTWVGAAGADWNTASNWSPAKVPTAADDVLFTGDASPSMTAADASAGNVKVSSGTVSITGNKVFRLNGTGGTGIIDVADGAAMTIGPAFYGNSGGAILVKKTGKGTFTFNNNVSYYVDSVEVAEGTVQLGTGVGGDGFNPVGALVTVRADAIFRTLGVNKMKNNVRVHLDAGATFDTQGFRDAIGAVTGEGRILGGGELNMTLYNGPHVFSGTTAAPFVIYIGDTSFPPVEDKSVLVLGSADALANVKLTVPAYTPSAPEKGLIRFAPGIDTFRIGILSMNAGAGLHLADTEGRPVTVKAGLGTSFGVYTGPGSLVTSGSGTGIGNAVFGAGQLLMTGFLGAADSNTSILGSNTVGQDPDLSSLSGLNAFANGTLNFKLAEPTKVDAVLAGQDGAYLIGPCADIEFANFSPTNCAVSTASVCSNITISGGTSLGGSIDLAGQSPDAKLAVTGGSSDGLRLSVSHAKARVDFAGGTHTNLTLQGYSAANAVGDYRVTGGDWTVANDFAVNGSHVFTVTGGRLAFEKGVKFGGSYSTNEFMFIATGGEIDIGPAPSATYPRGLGMDLSGTARAILPASGETLRVSSDGASHTIRVRDDALLCIRSKLSISHSATSLLSTGRVEVAGGTIHMSSQFTRGAGSTGIGSYIELILNGGTLLLDRTDAAGTLNLFEFYNETGMTMRFGATPTEICVDSDYDDAGYVLNSPLTTDVPGGTDGGFVKTGFGLLSLPRAVSLTGDVVIRDGALKTAAPGVASPLFGYGTLRTLGGRVAFDQTGACAVGPVSFSGLSTFSLAHTTQVAFDSLAAGEPGAALLFGDMQQGSAFDGGSAKVTLKDGAANDAATGLVKLPVVLCNNVVGNDRLDLSHARYDAEKGLVALAAVGGYSTAFATDGSGVTDVRDRSVTLSENAHVGGLRVRNYSAAPLTLGNGVVLTVGNGTDPAIVLLSSLTGANNAKTFISGGTLDFGTSRGYILGNLANGNVNASEVASSIVGTGGLTLGGVSGFASGKTSAGGIVILKLSGANAYSGGTLIDRASVEVSRADALGSGLVDVRGGESAGGALVCSFKGTLANPLRLAGSGSYVGYTGNSGAALRATDDVRVSEAVEVADSGAWVGIAPGRTLTFAGAVSGGRLTVNAEGTVRFEAANASLSGGVDVVAGTLTVVPQLALGTGEVRIAAGAKLRFENTGALTVANRITGSGTIVLAGSQKVEFGDLSGFEGVIEAAPGSTVDLNGKDSVVAGLRHDGAVVNSGADATLVIDSGLDTQFDGTIEDGVSLTKIGSGAQAFTGNLTYDGATTVAAGTVVLGTLQARTTLPVTNGKVFRLDASDATTVTCREDGQQGVQSWADADGGSFVFARPQDATVWPFYRTGVEQQVNGLNTVWFPGMKERLVAGLNASLRTVAVLMRPEISHPPAANNWMCGGIFGKTDKDEGVRFHANGPSELKWPLSDTPWGGLLYTDIFVNGEKTINITHGVPSLAWFETGASVTASSWSLGQYMAAAYARPYYGDMCEVIAYDRVLSDAEREMVEGYLMSKWGAREEPVWQMRVNVLPSSTDLTVADGATLDLAGSQQELASFDIAGMLDNSAKKAAVVKLSAGTSYLREGAAISPNIIFDLREGDAVIDLCGQTVTVRQFRGSESQIRNGTLIQLKPWGGLLLMVR